MGFFDSVELGPVDPILGMSAAYKKDTCDLKVDLGVGAYRDGAGKPHVFEVVRTIQKAIADDETMYKEYSPIDGMMENKKSTQELVFGADSKAVKENRVCSLQSISGTGALRLAGEFIKENVPSVRDAYISKPSWAIHRQLFHRIGFHVREYRYWNDATLGFDEEGMINDLLNVASGALVILHTCAHNPTGVDPTRSQWERILEVVKMRKLLVILDTAYQGFATGDLENDVYPIRLFEQAGLEFFVCQSFAKNLGLYGERMGMLHLVCSSEAINTKSLSQLKIIARCLYSSPPINGARILKSVMETPEYTKQWKTELSSVVDRLNQCRKKLVDGLIKKVPQKSWVHITNQTGMFSFTGLSVAQCEYLTAKKHIYLLTNGRISLAGLNESNVEYVSTSIAEAINVCP